MIGSETPLGYDPAMGAWEVVAPVGTGRSSCSTAMVGVKMYVVGGQGSGAGCMGGGRPDGHWSNPRWSPCVANDTTHVVPWRKVLHTAETP